MKNFFFGKSMSFAECWTLIAMMYASDHGYIWVSITLLFVYFAMCVSITVKFIDSEEDEVVNSNEENHRVA